MKKTNTKQEILSTALDLFSIHGYEATSISQLASAVGIRKASLYSHFASKQDVLDELIREVLDQYAMHSIFAKADWEDSAFTADKKDLAVDDVVKMMLGQVRYIVHDPLISKSRKLLTIEQFQNSELKSLQTKQNYSDVMKYFTGMIRFLIRQGKLIDEDAEIMAAQLCLPITVWINLCDREPEREQEAAELIERHIRQFFKLYQKSR